jgi:hypothetical protein
MRRSALAALAALFVTTGAARAQPPSPPSIDQLAADVIGIRAKRAELDKQEAEKLGAIAAELKRQRELLEKLGLDGPVPKPPTPVPPPAPADPLKARLKAAFDADMAAPDARRSQALDLAALYRQVAKLAQDKTVLTSGDLLARKKAAAATLVGADALKTVRAAVGAELGAIMPTDAPLTDGQRAATAAVLTKIATALEDIAK